MPNAAPGTQFIKTYTITASNAVLATAATALDAAVNTFITTLLDPTTAPAGYDNGSYSLCCPQSSYETDNSVYFLTQQIKYSITTP